jgi:hypothetical protein
MGWDDGHVNRMPPLATLVFGLVLVVAACGGGATPSPSAVDSGSTAPSVAVTPGTSPSAPGSIDAGASPSLVAPSGLALPHEDPDLEARLPDEVDGVKLFKLSVGPVASVGNLGAEPIRALAKEIGDGSGNFGLAFANDPTTGTYNLFALRIPGAESKTLLERYTALTVADTPGSETDSVTLAGKTVTNVTAPSNPIGDVWFYVGGDTLFGVQAGSEADAEKLLALLP